MTVKEFKLPDVGEGVAEGELVSWKVSPGDTVSEGDIVAEVETDKALVEVPSRYDGTVKELFAEEGEIVPVGDVIISFDVDEGPEAGDTEAEAPDIEGEPGEPADEAETDTEEAATAETPEGRVFAPPAARRLARELGVDIADVEGSGPGGRVSEQDVRAHHESAETHDETADETPVTPGEEAAEAPSGAGASETVSASDSPEAMRETTLATPATRSLADELGGDIDAVPPEKSRDGGAFVPGGDGRARAGARGGGGAAGAAARGGRRRGAAGHLRAGAGEHPGGGGGAGAAPAPPPPASPSPPPPADSDAQPILTLCSVTPSAVEIVTEAGLSTDAVASAAGRSSVSTSEPFAAEK